MPFGQTFERLAELLQPELARLEERQAVRIAGCDGVRYVASDRAVAYMRGGTAIWIARAELVARLSPGALMLRWWWYGAGTRGVNKSRLDAILSEGQQQGIREFSIESVVVEDEGEAERLCKLAAYIAHADGILRLEDAQGVAYHALFDAPGARLAPTDPPPPPSGRFAATTAPPAASRNPPSSMRGVPVAMAAPTSSRTPPRSPRPPHPSDAQEVSLRVAPSSSPLRAAAPLGGIDTDEPFQAVEASTSVRSGDFRAATPVSEPPRELLLPVAQRAMSEISTALGASFQRAMMVISVGVRDGKARFSINLVSVDMSGELDAHEASKELCAAVADLIASHAKLPGGRWRRLITRFRNNGRGASVDVTVSG